MQIEYLKDHTRFIPVIAKWFYREWGHYHPELSIKDIEKRLFERTNIDKLPLTIVALDEGELIGTASLKISDMDIRPQYRPWLASMFVKKDKRKQGIGKKLVEAIEHKAKSLGVEILYLYTPDAHDFYLKLGWVTVEQTQYRGAYVSIMKKELNTD